ncbi:MAG: YtxH domain-containing protein [Anaerolineae bacterium]|nr:YtxH domain-containing protein [Anaerolineae bacterium]
MMRKIFSLVVGLGLGAAVGVALVMLFAPTSGEQVVANLKRGWQETMDEARKASQQRRETLEAELAARRSRKA